MAVATDPNALAGQTATNGQAKALPVASSPIKPPVAPNVNPVSTSTPTLSALPVAAHPSTDPLAFAPNAGGPPPGSGGSGSAFAPTVPPKTLAQAGLQNTSPALAGYVNESSPGFNVDAAGNYVGPENGFQGSNGSNTDPSAQGNMSTAQIGQTNRNAAVGTAEQFINNGIDHGQYFTNTQAPGTTFSTPTTSTTDSINTTLAGQGLDPLSIAEQSAYAPGQTPGFGISQNGKPVAQGVTADSLGLGSPASGFIPPLGPNDVGTGATGGSGGSTSNPAGGTVGGTGGLPVTTSNSPTIASNGATLGSPTVGHGVALTPTTPTNALTNSTISVDPGVNRFDVAKNQLSDTIKNVLDPAYAANARTIAAQSFGAGRGVSGMNRTAEGNLASDQARTEAQLSSEFLNPALTGTIGDAQQAASLAAQQQGVQIGQQNTAFNQNVTAQQLADAEKGQSFNQALQSLIAGSSGDPNQLALELAQLISGQSAQNTAAASTLARSGG